MRPLLGERHVVVSEGQTIRINLPGDWIVLGDVGVDPATLPVQRVPSRGSGMAFTAAMPGMTTLTLAKGGTTHTINLTVEVRPYYGQAASGYYSGYGGGNARYQHDLQHWQHQHPGGLASQFRQDWRQTERYNSDLSKWQASHPGRSASQYHAAWDRERGIGG